jgi:hypothetical protein
VTLQNIELRKVKTQNIELKLPDFNTSEKGKDGNFASELDKLRNEAARKRTEESKNIQIDLIGLATNVVDAAESIAQAKKLADARQKIAQKHFKEALTILESILAEEPQHVEAVFLAALCEIEEEFGLEALRTLSRLRTVRLNPAMQTRVDALRERVRAGVLLEAVLLNLLVQSGERERAFAELGELVSLDPESAIWHCLMAHALLEADRPQEALKAAISGKQQALGDTSLLNDLIPRLTDRVAAVQMAPAVGFYKQRKYVAAKAALAGLDRMICQSRLWTLFNAYLSDLDSGGLLRIFSGSRKPADTPPRGSPQDQDALHFLLVGTEIRRGRESLQKEDFTSAAASFNQAITHAPHFPFAHHLYAIAIFSGLGSAVKNGKLPTPETLERGFKSALTHAKFGSRDLEIQDSKELIKAIQDGIDFAEGASRARQEAKPVNEAIEEFMAIIDSAKAGLDKNSYQTIRRRLLTLRDTVSALTRKVKAVDGQKALKDLSEAVARNLKQLDEIGGDIEQSDLVAELYDRVNNCMSRVKSRGGIRGRSEFLELKSFLETVLRDIERARKRITRKEGRDALNRLSTEVIKMLAALSG